MDKYCEYCGEPFWANRSDKRYCSTECRNKFHAKAAEERADRVTEFNRLTETKEGAEMLADGELRHPSLNDHIVCKRCGKIFESINKTRKYCSYDCRIEAQVEAGRARFGADTDRIVKSDWLTVLKRWRMDIISRDRYKCVHCGSTNSLTVHNIRHPVGYQGYHLGSGVTLCRDCLTAITGFEKDHEEELMKIAEERDDRQR